ncbi:MAG TPA: glycosyltransferase family 87 protein [Anaerolineales bacterium]|nr:glycosyltransferase family 87 protein [Anaerolineales bacterium]
MKKSLQIAFLTWTAATILMALQLAAIYLRNGMDGLNLFIQQWPLSNLPVTLAATALTWILAGALLYLLANDKVTKQNAFQTAGFFLVLFIYLNIFRERFRYGDYHYYLDAAIALSKGEALPATYLYLPLWVSLLQFIVSLGDQGVMIVLWILNIIALAVFYFLLITILQRYNFSRNLSVLITVLFLLINVPLLRTLGFIQVNLFVMDLIFLSLLTYPKNTLLSALTLALAVHLKTSPAVIVLAFLLEFNWKWLFWFAVSFLIIGVFPVMVNGISPYYDYFNNAFLLTQLTTTNFHDTSFDSFFRFLNPFFGIQLEGTRIIVLVAKVLLLGATLFVMAQNIRGQSFSKENRLLNAAPSLFVFMTLGSPIVWDHHGIFVTLAFLLLLKRIHTPAHWMIFLAIYFLQFMLPSFDFFPWSYGRLFAPIATLWLMYVTCRNEEPSPFITSANQWLAKVAN